MSTASEIMLRRPDAERRLHPVFQTMAEWTDDLLQRWVAIGLWISCLRQVGDATRYQLEWNGEWSGRTVRDWTLKQWARAVDLLYRDTDLPPATYAGAVRTWSDWWSQMDDEPPGAYAQVVGTWRFSLGGQCVERPAHLPHQPSMRAQEWAYCVRDDIFNRQRKATQ